jgi:hypothetical protein
VSDFIDRSRQLRGGSPVHMGQRMRYAARTIRGACVAASQGGEPDGALDPIGVRVLGATVYFVAHDAWPANVRAFDGETEWIDVYREAMNLWLGAEQRRLRPGDRRTLRTVARGLGWRWDPQRAGGAWYWEPDPVHRVEPNSRPAGSLSAKGPPSEFLIAKRVD